MNAAIKNMTAPSAAIRNETLVLTLPDAVNPVVWQFDLGSVKASALEINPAGDHFALRLKTPRGEIHDIALYAERDRAVSILTIVHQTLVGSVANDAPPAQGNEVSGGSRFANWPLAVSAVLMFFVVLYVLGVINPGISQEAIDAAVAQSNAAQPEIGVPQSADDILQGRVP